jgi:hypothetical protein
LASVYMFCAPELVFGGTDGVGSRFHVLRSRARFRLCEGCLAQFSCFALSVLFSAVRRASGPVFMFCAPVLVFDSTEDVGSRFHVLRSGTHFRWYRVCQISFSCVARPDSFSAVMRASDPIFMFFAPGNVFGGTEGVGSHFDVLHTRTRFLRNRGRQLPFSCFGAPELVFDGTNGIGSRFDVLRSRFQRKRGRRVSFSYFVLPDMFLAVRRA